MNRRELLVGAAATVIASQAVALPAPQEEWHEFTLRDVARRHYFRHVHSVKAGHPGVCWIFSDWRTIQKNTAELRKTTSKLLRYVIDANDPINTEQFETNDMLHYKNYRHSVDVMCHSDEVVVRWFNIERVVKSRTNNVGQYRIYDPVRKIWFQSYHNFTIKLMS